MTAPMLTARERELLGRPSWTIDELITLAFVLRRVVGEIDDVPVRNAVPSDDVTKRYVVRAPDIEVSATEVRRTRKAAREAAKVAGYFRGGR